jgi:BirA family biotin operon repressor/biotin-[acetyl-CoA-carboxylase] ligase
LDPAPAALAPELGFVAGVAMGSCLRELLGNDTRLTLKWPNDVLYDRAKLCGMLLESSFLANGKLACVIGIGVNISSHPEGLAYPATDLAAIGCPVESPKAVLAAISDKLAHWLAVWGGPDGFSAIRREWLQLVEGLGAPVRIMTASGSMEGLFKTIDHAGRLVLATDGKEVAISAGDVFFTSGQISS